MPSALETAPAAAAFQEIVTQMRRAYAKGAAEQQQAEQEGIELRDRVRANLADMSGKVTVNVHAESEQGFDKSKLQNGVLEPLKEAGLIQ